MATVKGKIYGSGVVSGTLSGTQIITGAVDAPKRIENPYVLPVATPNTLGGVKSSTGTAEGDVSVSADGKMVTTMPVLANVAKSGEYEDLSGKPESTPISFNEINNLFS